MARKSNQLDAEIAAAMAHGSGDGRATVRDWQNLKDSIWNQLARIPPLEHRTAADAQRRAILNEEWKSANQGLRAARQAEKATKKGRPTTVTGNNLSALKDLVVKHGSGEFAKGHSAGNPHIKRCISGGLVELIDSNNEVTGRIFQAKKLRLTPSGREAVADLIISDIGREGRWTPRDLVIVPKLSASQHAAVVAGAIADHDAKVKRLEGALAGIRRRHH